MSKSMIEWRQKGRCDMSISKYQMFLKTAACGNFSKAAEAMNFTQSGVSHAVQSLEEELGVTLLSRTAAA